MSHQSARLKNGNDRTWRKIRERILIRDAYLCQYCGNDANTVDHVLPVSRGGTDEPDNLLAACTRCNSSRGNRMNGFFSVGVKPLTLPLSISPQQVSTSHD
jgi:5-methylcytosine-specific restriction endonuclease McrA